jgi:protein SCO1
MWAIRQSKRFDDKSSEEEIAAFVDRVKDGRNAQKLLPFLDYAHPIYKGRSKNATLRLRGYIIEAFAHTGLPASAIAFVLDELESSISPYVVAAAAKALRRGDRTSANASPFLLKALKNVRMGDDQLTFKTYKPHWPIAEHTTATKEVLITLGWLGNQAKEVLDELKVLEKDPCSSPSFKQLLQETILSIEQSSVGDDCCAVHTFSMSKKAGSYNSERLSRVQLQDENDQTVSYEELLTGAVSVLLLFYTRCDNPNRCSRNVTRFGQLQRMVQEKDLDANIRLIALTYDPEYDFSFRTRAYCGHRGFLPGGNSHISRVTRGWDDMRDYLNPNANYNDGLLNSHTTDLFVLDKRGKVAKRISGIEWENEKVIGILVDLLAKETKQVGWINNFMSVIVSAVLVFFPKCPFCVAAYLSMLGISQVQFFTIKAWMIPMLGAMLLINLGALLWMAWKRRWFLPFYVSLAGAAMAAASAISKDEVIFPAYVWIALIATGSLLNGIPRGLMTKIRWPKLKLYAMGNTQKKTSIQ